MATITETGITDLALGLLVLFDRALEAAFKAALVVGFAGAWAAALLAGAVALTALGLALDGMRRHRLRWVGRLGR